MKKGYKLDLINRTVSLTREFVKSANNPKSDEYALYTKFVADGFRITKRTSHSSGGFKENRNLTYKNMETYIMAQDDRKALLVAFAEVKTQSKGQRSPYNFVKEWFLDTFPTYNEVPVYTKKDEPLTLTTSAAKEDDSAA